MDINRKKGMLKEGTRLSERYSIIGYLASGGFGNTYKAERYVGDKVVATVVIKELFIKDICHREESGLNVSISNSDNSHIFEVLKRKFKHEAERLAVLKHENIVRVTDLFEENGTQYYVMEYIEGESLSQRLKSTNTPLSEEEVMGKILPQILDALEYLHTLPPEPDGNGGPLYHLDIKPGNIMVDRKGTVKLIDFGSSKQVNSEKEGHTTTSSLYSHTPGYAPSELVEGNSNRIDCSTDLYSLGATIYNLLTNKRPPHPSDINEEGSDAFNMPETKIKDLIIKLMSQSKKRRPQNVAEVRQLLEEKEKSEYEEVSTEGQDEEDTDLLIEVEEDTEDYQYMEIVSRVSQKSVEPQKSVDPRKPINPQLTSSKKKIDNKSTNLKILCYVAAALIVMGCVALKFIPASTSNQGSILAKADTLQVKDTLINVDSGPENMRQYSYTGALIDSVGALPNGKGVAKFEKYKNIPAATYVGNFVDGLCNDTTGTATLIYTTGEAFTGVIKDGYIYRGTYVLPDQSYFKGSFQNGEPYNGKWYNADNSFSADVVNGNEQNFAN